MDGWMDAWMDGLKHEWIVNIRRDGWTDRSWTNRYIDEQMDEWWMDEWINVICFLVVVFFTF